MRWVGTTGQSEAEALTPTQEFVTQIVTETAKAGVLCSFMPLPEIRVGGSVPATGVFDSDRRLLIVATGRPRKSWLGILAHEFGHYQQWRTDCSVWQATYLGNGVYGDNFVDQWLTGVCELSEEQRSRYFGVSQDVELDCERRALRLLRRWLELEVDLEAYAIRASAYVYSYTVAAVERLWLRPGRLDSQLPRLRELCPPKLQPQGWYADTEGRRQRLLYEFLVEKCMGSLLTKR